MIYLPISLARGNFARPFVYYSRLDAQLGHPKGEHETGRTGADNEHIDLGCFHIDSARCRRLNTQLEKLQVKRKDVSYFNCSVGVDKIKYIRILQPHIHFLNDQRWWYIYQVYCVAFTKP